MDLLAATEKDLAVIAAAVRRARKPLRGEAAIALKVGAVVNRRKMAKHFDLVIGEANFAFHRKAAAIAAEAALDGIYVVRTSLPQKALDNAATVGAYKSLAQVERAFRSLKTVDIHLRPIFHWTAPRVRAHVFLCMLAYHVEHHMRARLAPMLYDETDHEAAAAHARQHRGQSRALHAGTSSRAEPALPEAQERGASQAEEGRRTARCLAHAGGRADPTKYRFCELYRAWEARLSPTMRQIHVAGERMFVDYAGATLVVISPILANVYLHYVFDLWTHAGAARRPAT